MNSELKPFDEKAACPKCGGAVIGTYWQKERAFIPSFPVGGDYEKREHLRRTCQRCQFGWNEATVDASSESEPNPL